MFELKDKSVLVLGLDRRGQAACELLCRQGVKVTAVEAAASAALETEAARLRALGVEVVLGATGLPQKEFHWAVISPVMPSTTAVVQEVLQRHLPMIGELELGYQQANCLSIAIAGTNGKSTTAGLVERMLSGNGRKALWCGQAERPVCEVVEQSKNVDFLLTQADAFQLGMTEFFRPVVSVLLNLAPAHLDRYATQADYIRANGRLFRNQQAFDWCIIQQEALARLRELKLPVPGKVITFSAQDREADLHLDHGLIVSRLENWNGPLLDPEKSHLRGPHNAENLMAALAVGHALRLPLESMREPLKTYQPAPHRCQLVGEAGGVQFINDSKATNLDALHKALLSARPGPGGQANVWLIAGGQDGGVDYHDIGPVLSQRVKKTFLIGEAARKIQSAWSLFTPCTVSGSLLEAVGEAAKHATSGDVVLLSPACSSLDQFQNYQHRGEAFCDAVKAIAASVPVDGAPRKPGN